MTQLCTNFTLFHCPSMVRALLTWAQPQQMTVSNTAFKESMQPKISLIYIVNLKDSSLKMNSWETNCNGDVIYGQILDLLQRL